MPWVPPVPLVTPTDYGRTRADQYMLNMTLIYSGYWGPYFGTRANSYNSSNYRYSGTNNPYAAPSSSSSQNSTGQNSSKQNSYTPTQPATPVRPPLAAAAYPSHEPLLEGLADMKLKEVHAQRGDVVNARKWMRPKELTTLIESVNDNGQVYRNAQQLTERLQSAGVLHAGDRVVGFADGKVYVLLASR